MQRCLRSCRIAKRHKSRSLKLSRAPIRQPFDVCDRTAVTEDILDGSLIDLPTQIADVHTAALPLRRICCYCCCIR
jgi:hypothetical protein